MKILRKRSQVSVPMMCFAVVVFVFIGCGSAFGAESPSNAELYQLILKLQEENQELRAQVKSLSANQEIRKTEMASDTVAQMQPGHAEADKGVSVEVGIDQLFLDFYAAQGATGDSSVGNNDDYFPDMGTELTQRYWIEIQKDNKVGLRGRYLDYDRSKVYLGLNRSASFKLLDLELTVPVSVSSETEFKPFIGYRRAEIELDGSDFGESNPYQFSGDGLTLGVDLNHVLFGSQFSLAAGARYSLLYGKTEFQPSSSATLKNTIMSGVELFAGVEYLHDFGNFELGVQAGYEQQYYGTDTYFPFAIDPETIGDVSLGGPVISVKLKY